MRLMQSFLMAEIVLSTLNAKYVHASFGLRYLFANLGALQKRAKIAEFDINQKPLEIVEAILAENPAIVGLGVYIWNARESAEVVALLKKLRPNVGVILGGPEVSFETEEQQLVKLADYVITGEADLKFAEVCSRLLAGELPSQKVIPAELPPLALLRLPYHFYTDEDVAHRVVYVEASRGCPFTCEFCLSSLDVPVRQFNLDDLLSELDILLKRGLKQFKFVDRTFNLNLNTSKRILQFFLDRYFEGLFVHFEMIPDRLPEGLREVIARFPAGALQFEVGIQTFNPEVAANISRRQDYKRLEDNFKYLRAHTGVHIHADLIAGLPGETFESFGAGFDRLIALGPQEIQVGILKRLRGTPISRHTETFGMIYNPLPPYELLQNNLLTFEQMQLLRRFSRYWDLIGNSGNFVTTTPLIWVGDKPPFSSFIELTEYLYSKVGRQHGIALTRLAELLFEFLVTKHNNPAHEVARALWQDYQRGGRYDRPGFLQDYITHEEATVARRESLLPKRQQKFVQTTSLTANGT